MLENYSNLMKLQITNQDELGNGWKTGKNEHNNFSKTKDPINRNQYRLVRMALDLFERVHRLKCIEYNWIKSNTWVQLSGLSLK